MDIIKLRMMNKYQHDLILSSFIEQEYKLDQIATGSEWHGTSRVVKFMDKGANVCCARFGFKLFCFVEISIITDLGIEYIKLV